MIKLLTSLVQNKHTSGAALAYFGAKVLLPILAIWFPGHEAQIQKTAEIIEGGSVAYGLLMAGDATKSATKADISDLAKATGDAIKSGDTTTLTKKS
jgi:hypothetical protein